MRKRKPKMLIGPDVIFNPKTGILHLSTPTNKVKAPVKKRNPKQGPTVTFNHEEYTPDEKQIVGLGLYYDKRFREVKGVKKSFFKFGLTKQHKSWKYFEEAYKLSQKLLMRPTDFVEAQFWWFNRFAKTLPRPFDLISRPLSKTDSVTRAKELLKLYQNAPIYTPPKPIKDIKQLEPEAEYTYFLKTLNDMAAIWRMSEEDVFNTFGTQLFSPEFIHSRRGQRG